MIFDVWEPRLFFSAVPRNVFPPFASSAFTFLLLLFPPSLSVAHLLRLVARRGAAVTPNRRPFKILKSAEVDMATLPSINSKIINQIIMNLGKYFKFELL